MTMIWQNGKLVAKQDASISVLSHSLHYGIALFEGVRAYECLDGRTAIFRLDCHTRRLFDSAKIYGLTLPFDKTTINQAHLDVLRANHLKSAYLRPLVWLMDGDLGVAAHNDVGVMVAALQWKTFGKSISARTASYTHHAPNSTMSKAKAATNYPVGILAHREARASGADESILLDPQGYICQGTAQNVFVVKDGVLYTPDLSSGALNGITRQSVMTMAQDLGIPVIEKRITRDECYIADELFLTGTGAQIVGVHEYDGRVIGDGSVGQISAQIIALYDKVVTGQVSRYHDWLTFV